MAVRSLWRRVETEEMGTGHPVRTLVIMALPAATAGILQTTFELVDMLFVSHLGKQQLSGVALVTPVFMMVYALAMPVSVGISALASRYLGARRDEDARDVVNHGLIIAVIVGGLLTLFLPPLARQIVARLHGTGMILEYGTQFLSLILYAAVLGHVGMVADAALRAQGNTITPMRIMGVANLANIALSGLFIFGLHWGVRGSAAATLVARSGMVLVLLSRLWAPGSRLRPGRLPGRRLFGRWRLLADLYWIGLPPSLAMVAMSVSLVLINQILIGLNPIAVGVQGIGWRIEMFAFVPVFGMFSALLPMVGYNFGAHQYRRCRETIRGAALVAAAFMGAVGVLLFAFPGFFLRLFGNDPEVMTIGVNYLHINSLSYALAGASIMISAGFQALGKSYLSMICQLFRTLVVRYPTAYALAKVAGVVGVWWSTPASTAATFLLTLVLMRSVFRGLGADAGALEAQPEAVAASVDSG